jgi:hypothetical protein
MGQLSDGPASSVPQSAATFFSPNNNKQQQQQLNGSGGGLSSKTTTSKNLNKFPFGASAAALLCDYLEKILVWMFADSEDPGAGPLAAGKPAGDPHYFLTGSFGPVASETDPASGLTVSGSIPECLNGEFVQVAPNPRFSPVSKYHWFDGDGYDAFDLFHSMSTHLQAHLNFVKPSFWTTLSNCHKQLIETCNSRIVVCCFKF